MSSYKKINRRFLSLIEKWVSTKGLLWTINRLKLIRLISTRYLSGQPIMVYPELVGITKDGFPKAIEFLKEYADGTTFQKRYFLTLMVVSRSLEYVKDPDYSSITDPFKGKYQTIDQDFIKAFVRDFLTKEPWIKVPFSSEAFYMTMKSGPLGHALLTSMQHFLLYTGLHIQHFLIIGGSHVGDYLLQMRNLARKIYPSKPQGGNRKLALVHDPEAKTRVIAIADYFTQVILNPFSKWCFELLRNIPQDRTFTQDPYLNKVPGQKFHSLDLSSATDRFPLALQRQLLSEMTDSNFAYSWSRLMVAEAFRAPDGRLLKYSVGQPMGLRSSWAVFTLSHHLVVQYSAYRVGLYPFKDYILLGDDIVIANDMVADEYRMLMRDLGVDISPMKSHVSENTYEFAKRWFQDGKEITGLPVNSFVSQHSNYYGVYTEILNQMKRGLSSVDLKSTLDLVIDLYKSTNKVKSSRLNYVTKLVRDFGVNLRVLNGDYSYESLRRFLGEATKDHEGYPLANEQAMLQEYCRAGSLVVNTMILSVVNRVTGYARSLQQKLPLLYSSNDESFPLNKDELKHTPIWSGLTVHLVKLAEDNSKVSQPNEPSILLKQLETTALVDIDKLSLRERNSQVVTRLVASFSSKLYKELRFDPLQLIAPAQRMRAMVAFKDSRKALGLKLKGDARY